MQNKKHYGDRFGWFKDVLMGVDDRILNTSLIVCLSCLIWKLVRRATVIPFSRKSFSSFIFGNAFNSRAYQMAVQGLSYLKYLSMIAFCHFKSARLFSTSSPIYVSTFLPRSLRINGSLFLKFNISEVKSIISKNVSYSVFVLICSLIWFVSRTIS